MGRKASTVLVIVLSAAAGVAVWAGLRFTAPELLRSISSSDIAPVETRSTAELWAQAVAKVKEDRLEVGEANPLEIPPEVQHHSDRRVFLATQVAEVRKHQFATYQDFLDLAATIQRGELVDVPAVTETYVLFGVGQIADDGPFTRHGEAGNVDLYDEQQLGQEFARLDAANTSLATEISDLNKQIAASKRDRTRRSELQKQLTTRQQELAANDEQKQLLHELYDEPTSRDRLFRDYASLQTLARDFRGRSFDLQNPADRQVLKITLLSSLRPQALKVLESIAALYHQKFDRPLPVSSLVRPEQYQRALRKRNRSATTIETPPHSTGLAFDIDYRYMSVAEQNLIMAELARLKQAGRIEVLRERSANYHVFVFLDGTRPSEDLVTAALEEVGAGGPEATPATAAPASSKNKSARGKSKSKRTQRAKTSPKRRRR